MRISVTAFLLLLVCLPGLLAAQRRIVKGRVIDIDSSALQGVMVKVKESATSTSTDVRGTFTIPVPITNDTLVFSLPGYARIQYPLTSKNRSIPVTIILHPIHTILAGSVSAPEVESTLSVRDAGSEALRDYSSISKLSGISYNKESLDASSRQLTKKAFNTRSYMLTAGELSDFKKWKLWGDYTASTFLQFSRQWSISPKRRYCVQLQNQAHVAIAGEKVSLLIAGTNDTVWQAVTDNTGKAELWGNVFGDELDKTGYSIACKTTAITAPVQFENGINRITLKQPCNVYDNVELAFVVDATGSMSDEIRYLQEELQDLIAKTAARYKDVKLKSAAIFYRDRSDEYLTRHINFTTDPSELASFVKQQAAAGGGDYPEAVEDALATALDSLAWSETARAKILFLVLDAPPHDKARDRIAKQVKSAAKSGIRIIPVVCSGVDKSTEYLMRAIALATNGTYVFLTDDSGIGNSHIKPTTDAFKVEMLNDLLQRLINEMVFVAGCGPNNSNEPVILPEILVKVSVFPNPSSGLVNIQFAQAVREILITDFTGKVLFRPLHSAQKGRLQIDLSKYPSGTYLVKYDITGKGWGAERIVVVH